MIIRRMVSGALATAVIAGGGITLAPSAFAKPRQCGMLAVQANNAWDLWVWSNGYYGPNSPQAHQNQTAYSNAVRAELLAGC
jgi:hypothetical protein